MKVLFLTLALSLFSILQAQESSSSEEQFEGTYFVKAIVAHNELPRKKKHKHIPPLTVTQFSDGNLEVKLTSNKHGRCKEIKFKLEKTNQPGIFSADEGKRQVLIEKTSVKDHWIIFSEGEFYGRQIRIADLLGLDLEENAKALEEYKKFVSLKGFKQEEIDFPIQLEACTPEHD
ncbi:late lactation protein B-like [Trichosurus vulpecula]|uniref:late lactation protein B-like n=1 Tax=Trichosurus vulpecula TaxID=9337 RepID=UPI00186AE557|nr:late lactation protein B-like [Trichosurus vulpecula]